jgi:uncharacterized protein YtpQ (UPF0354 family)
LGRRLGKSVAIVFTAPDELLKLRSQTADSLPMWLWGSLAWCFVALGGVALHHRLRTRSSRYPPEVAAFVLQLENELAAHHPGVAFLGMLPDRFACLMNVDGQETPVGLYEAFRHAEAFPGNFPSLVARLVEDIREVGLDRADDLEFATAAQLLMPQVRSAAWLQQQGTFGDSGLVHTAINEQLVTVYVVDDASCMVFLCRAHLKRWQKATHDVHNLALANLARLGRNGIDHAAAEAVLLQSGDGFDASRLLLLDQVEGLLVAVPDRDTLWVGPEAGQNIEQLMAVTEQIADRSNYPVSAQLFRVSDGRLEPVPTSR